MKPSHRKSWARDLLIRSDLTLGPFFMGWESSDVVRFDLGPLLQGQMRTAKLKSVITRLLLVLEVCNVKSTNRKSWAGNLLMWLNVTLDPFFNVK